MAYIFYFLKVSFIIEIHNEMTTQLIKCTLHENDPYYISHDVWKNNQKHIKNKPYATDISLYEYKSIWWIGHNAL